MSAFAGARLASHVPSSAVMVCTSIDGGSGARVTVGAIESSGPVPMTTFALPIIVEGGPAPGSFDSSPRTRTGRRWSALISALICALPVRR